MSKKCSARSGFYQKQGGGVPKPPLENGVPGGEGGGGGGYPRGGSNLGAGEPRKKGRQLGS